MSHLSKFVLLMGRVCKLAVTNRRGLREVAGVALGTSDGVMDPETDVLPIPRTTLTELVTECDTDVFNINLRPFPHVEFSITMTECMGLALLMHKCKARRAFEFGTHRGVSSTQLAANLPEDGKLFTLDLPRSNTSTHFTVDDAAEKRVANYPVKGDLIPADLRKKVTFLENDSALFDPTPYEGTMDFIFVDAAHTWDYVKNDSEKAWKMLKPGGIIAWHDCRAESPDVVKYLRANPFYNWRRIQLTTLAFAEKPKT
jgi:predicted O-methyltransferase YrrM